MSIRTTRSDGRTARSGAGERRAVEDAAVGDGVTLDAVGVGCVGVGAPDVCAGGLLEGEHAINRSTRRPDIAVDKSRRRRIINRL
jgi:hypothetical protein